MSGRRSVLVVVDVLAPTGSLRWAHQLAELWLRSGWAVDYLSLKVRDHREGRLLPPTGATITYGDTALRRFRRAFPVTLLRGMRAAVAADLVLAISEVGLSLPFGYLLARLSRRPFVVYTQSIVEHAQSVNLSRRQLPLWRFCLAHADAVLCVSPVVARSATRLGVQPARVTVVPTGLDVDATRRLGLPGGGRRLSGAAANSLVACGELYPHKGYDLLLRAVASVRATGRRVRVTLIGQGRERPALERLAQELGVADAVTFSGQVPNPLPEIARAGAFVHCARVEAVGLALLEAMALGVPTIAADCAAGGPRLVLDEGRLGRLVEPDSVSALAEAICAHLDDPARLAELAARGPAAVRERFLPGRSAAAALDVFTGLCESRRRLRFPAVRLPQRTKPDPNRAAGVGEGGQATGDRG
jgi:glycosyltransferase involved in cell wall biosynthesis